MAEHEHKHGHPVASHGRPVSSGHVHGNEAPPAASMLSKDPVCGMMVDPHTAKHRHEAGRQDLLLLFRGAAARSSPPNPALP